MKTIIDIKNLTKQYGKVIALDNVSFSICEGELFGLLGINGAGKSTLIKTLCCLISPTAGTAKIYDFDIVKDEEKVKNIINISPQETSIAPNLTVKENLEFFASIYFVDKSKIAEKVSSLMQTFGLEEVKNKRAKTLSGGYKRRLSIAIALISEPKVLFLDEPTLGLDIISRKTLWNIINSLKGKTTIILTTHYLEEIEFLCDRVGILANGKIKFVGTINDCLKKTKQKTFEAAFISLSQGEEK